MTKQQAIDIIADRLGNRSGMDSRIVMELDASQEFHEQHPFHPWFLRTREVVVASSPVIPLPDNFLAPLEDREILLGPDGPVKAAFDWQVDPIRGQVGKPTHYVLFPHHIELYPAPSEPITYTLSYYAKQPLISTLGPNEANAWLSFAPHVIVQYAGAKIAMHLRGTDVAQLFLVDYQEATRNLLHNDVAWRSGGMLQFMGG
ncbi:MAG: hypothetical protein ACP5QB_10110 [Thiomonas sp.]